MTLISGATRPAPLPTARSTAKVGPGVDPRPATTTDGRASTRRVTRPAEPHRSGLPSLGWTLGGAAATVGLALALRAGPLLGWTLSLAYMGTVIAIAERRAR